MTTKRIVVDAPRAFKTAWFSKAAAKVGITDVELCAAFHDLVAGRGDDLGGGVYKKRLAENRHRSIVVAKGGRVWVYAFLFAKQDRANIASDELVAFKKLAALYAKKTDADIATELACNAIVEICND